MYWLTQNDSKNTPRQPAPLLTMKSGSWLHLGIRWTSQTNDKTMVRNEHNTTGCQSVSQETCFSQKQKINRDSGIVFHFYCLKLSPWSQELPLFPSILIKRAAKCVCMCVFLQYKYSHSQNYLSNSVPTTLWVHFNKNSTASSIA